MTKKELDELMYKKSEDMAEKKWVIGQQSVYKNGFKDGSNACSEILLPIIKDYEYALEFYAHEVPDVYDVSDAYDPLHFDDGRVAKEMLKKHRGDE